ncbi:hypothetical protein BC332_30073 [Capsicum chinense]|nr:hypothetical protein BC332_30073 [Capsicum chinense]
MGAATDSFAHCLIIANKLELQLEILSMSKVSTSLLWKSIDSAYSSFCLSGVTSCGSHCYDEVLMVEVVSDQVLNQIVQSPPFTLVEEGTAARKCGGHVQKACPAWIFKCQKWMDLKWHKFCSHSWPLIIALTASSEEQVRERCLQVGMNGLIRKPVLLQGLADVSYNDSFKRGGGVGL